MLTQLQTEIDPETGKQIITSAAQKITQDPQYIQVRQAIYKHGHRVRQRRKFFDQLERDKARWEAAQAQAKAEERSAILIDNCTPPEGDAAVLPSTPRPACTFLEAGRECTAVVSPVRPTHSYVGQLCCGMQSPYVDACYDVSNCTEMLWDALTGSFESEPVPMPLMAGIESLLFSSAMPTGA